MRWRRRWNSVTAGERIPGESRTARADGTVVDDLAFGVLSAGSWARVDALLVDASPVGSALGADHTLRSAARGRTDVLR